LLEVGVGEIAPAVQNLGDRIAAGVSALGYEVLGERTPASGSGIVSFRKPGLEAPLIVRRLREAGISCAPRAGWVRTSPHFYISPADIDRHAGRIAIVARKSAPIGSYSVMMTLHARFAGPL